MTVADPIASHVQVVVRVRPLTPKEHLDSPHACLSLLQPIVSTSPNCENNIGGMQPFDEDPLLARNQDTTDIYQLDTQQQWHNNYLTYKQVMLGKNQTYTFDTIYAPGAQQAHLYTQSVVPLLDRFMEGYHATVFAYGQTGSGKTYTMGTGMEGSILEEDEQLGIIPRAIQEMFARLETQYGSGENAAYQIYVSFLEIYNENIKDLLSPASLSSSSNKQLVIREDASGEIYLAGCMEERIRSPKELYEALRRGSLCRTTGSTDMNLSSSRSHAIFSVILRQQRENEDGLREQVVSKFHFVDLAGSERLKKTNAIGNRAKEAISINGGLLALGNVISALSSGRRNGHIPYRDSKLTRLLQNSLGGNSQTLMLACVSPAESNQSETLNTLQYANRAKQIRNRAQVNVDANGLAFENAQLKKLVMYLKQDLLSLRNAGSSGGGPQAEAFQALKAAKTQLEKKLSEYISENTSLQLKLELGNLRDTTSLDHLLSSPPIEHLREQIIQLRSQLVLATQPAPTQKAPTLIVPDDLLHTLTNPDDLRQRVAQLQAALMDKMDLQSRHDKFREEYQVMKSKYEESIAFLNASISALKKERDGMLAGRRSTGNSNPNSTGGMTKLTRDKYEERIKQLMREKERAKAAHDEILAQMKGRSGQDQTVQAIKAMNQQLKHEKQLILKSMSDELVKLKTTLDGKEAQIKELKLLEKQANDDVKKFKKYYEYQKSLNIKKSILLSNSTTTSNNNPIANASGLPTNSSVTQGLKRRKSDNNLSVVTAAPPGTDSEAGEPDDPMEIDTHHATNLSDEGLQHFKTALEDELVALNSQQDAIQRFLTIHLQSLTLKDTQSLLSRYILEKYNTTPSSHDSPTMPCSPILKPDTLTPSRKNAFIFSRSDIHPK